MSNMNEINELNIETSETIGVDLLNALVQEIKLLKKPWEKLSQNQQDDLIDRLRDRIGTNVARAVHRMGQGPQGVALRQPSGRHGRRCRVRGKAMRFYYHPNWRYISGKAKSRALRGFADALRIDGFLRMSHVEQRKQTERLKSRHRTIWDQSKYWPTPYHLQNAFDWRFAKAKYPT